jgi:hypothetical protein
VEMRGWLLNLVEIIIEGVAAMIRADRNGTSGSESDECGRADVRRDVAHKRRKSQNAGERKAEYGALKNRRRQMGGSHEILATRRA